MKCNAPTKIVFIISVILAVLSLLGFLGVVGAISAYSFWIAFASWVVLAAGCVFKGL